jgi:DoxX-like family
VLGAIAILVPRFPRLKEWAYAGIFFDLTGAAASCAAVGGYGAYGFHVIAPLLIAVLAVASWALRPPSRTIGVLFRPTNGRPV